LAGRTHLFITYIVSITLMKRRIEEDIALGQGSSFLSAREESRPRPFPPLSPLIPRLDNQLI